MTRLATTASDRRRHGGNAVVCVAYLQTYLSQFPKAHYTSVTTVPECVFLREQLTVLPSHSPTSHGRTATPELFDGDVACVSSESLPNSSCRNVSESRRACHNAGDTDSDMTCVPVLADRSSSSLIDNCQCKLPVTHHLSNHASATGSDSNAVTTQMPVAPSVQFAAFAAQKMASDSSRFAGASAFN